MTPSPLTPIHDDLLATPTSVLPYQQNVRLRSYILRRPQGNLLVYNSPGIRESRDQILSLGHPARLLITHAHEAMYGAPGVDVPVWAHHDDAGELSSLSLAGTFTGRQMIDDDVEVIPTPGHTVGTTSYLWDSGTHRYLFTGDFIWIEGGQWKAVVLDHRLRDRYLQSLALIRDLDFDVLVPWGVTEGDAPADVVRDHHDRRDRIQAIIDRVAAGSDR